MQFGTLKIEGLLVLMLAAGAHATLITPGGPPVSPDNFKFKDFGAQQADLSGNWSTADGGKGKYQAAVYTDTITGKLDFVYQFTVFGSSSQVLTQLTGLGFGGVTTDVGFTPNGAKLTPAGSFKNGTVEPSQVVRPVADTILFDFTSNVIPQSKIDTVLVIKTNASSFIDNPSAIGLFAGAGGDFAGFSPNPVVPEPSFFVLTGAGLAGLIAWRRRDRIHS